MNANAQLRVMVTVRVTVSLRKPRRVKAGPAQSHPKNVSRD
jgi:hypothetical protein